MEVSFKRRLVGAIVLGIIAVLLLPSIFDGDGRIPQREVEPIPPTVKKPDTSELKVDLPVQARQKPKADPEPIALIEAKKPEASEDIEDPILDNHGNAKAWVLQLASFKNARNAKKLVDKLRAENFRAFAKEHLLSNGSMLTQVMVGPEQDYKKIETIKADIQAKSASLGVSGPPLIIRFKP